MVQLGFEPRTSDFKYSMTGEKKVQDFDFPQPQQSCFPALLQLTELGINLNHIPPPPDLPPLDPELFSNKETPCNKFELTPKKKEQELVKFLSKSLPCLSF